MAMLMIAHVSEAKTFQKSLWIWNTSNIIGVTAEENKVLNESVASSITDIYLYVQSGTITGKQVAIQKFIEQCSCNGIRVWGMDGWRGYFADQCGPSGFYKVINAVITYNTKSTAKQKFYGFAGDNEFVFQDMSGDCVSPANADVFHYGSTDASLSTTAGSGFWRSTERQDRDSICTDWVKQTHDAAVLCHNAGLQYSIAVMSWITGLSYTHAAMGNQKTPLYSYYKGVKKELCKALMDYVDEYVIMSYHTNVNSKVSLMCKDHLDYANTLADGQRPRVLSAIETHCLVDQYVSYCDTPPQNTKPAANYGMVQHTDLFGSNISYAGVGIHDWVGWSGLSPVSNNTTALACVEGISEHLNPLDITISPNPVIDILNVELNNTAPTIQMALYSIDGKKIFSSANEATSAGNIQHSIDVSFLNAGIYILKITSNSSDKTIKIIKN
jgi:hypothetical protein